MFYFADRPVWLNRRDFHGEKVLGHRTIYECLTDPSSQWVVPTHTQRRVLGALGQPAGSDSSAPASWEENPATIAVASALLTTLVSSSLEDQGLTSRG